MSRLASIARYRWLLDLLALLLLLGLGVELLPSLHLSQSGTELPWWATPRDLLLDGPDAGSWAAAAMAVRDGDFAAIDPHRLPAWPLLVGLALHWQPDVALAGHAVNHLLFLLLPLAVYGLGVLAGGRGVGLLAAVLVQVCAPLYDNAQHFAVDVAVSFFLALALLAAGLAARWRWWLALPAGALAAYAASSHYLALPYALPAALFAAIQARPGRRLHAGLALLLGAAAAFWEMTRLFPFPTVGEFFRSVSAGIAPSTPGGGQSAISEQAWTILRHGLGTSLDGAVLHVIPPLRPAWLPWSLALALPWLGVLGLGLGAVPRSGRLRFPWDPLRGLVLLSTLAPLPLLAASRAPSRYSWLLLPFVAVLLARGWASLLALPRLLWSWWSAPAALLQLALAAWLGLTGWRALGYPHRFSPPESGALAARALGRRLAAHFPPGGSAACPLREAAAYAGRAYCPGQVCPLEISEEAFRDCLRVLARECRGTGPIPYVAFDELDEVLRIPPQVAMDRWVGEHWEPLETFRGPGWTARIYSIPREVAERGGP